MAAKLFNITGEQVQQLILPGENIIFSKVSLTNIHGTSPCTVDLYIEKLLTGTFYLIKDIKLPVGATLIHDIVPFNSKVREFGLYIKLTKSASETPAVDVILH